MERQALIDGSVQPGGRAPAPGPLALVQAFVNTVDREHGPDLLDGGDRGDGWRAWCAARGLRADLPVDEASSVREALRLLLWGNGHTPPADLAPPGGPGGAVLTEERLAHAAATLDAAAARLALRPRFGPHPRIAGETPGGAAAEVLAATFAALADGTWRRLKACPGTRCGWAFYDRSAAGSSAWCSMRICGQRAKARSYYRRQRS